jgi:hypothetical protein
MFSLSEYEAKESIKVSNDNSVYEFDRIGQFLLGIVYSGIDFSIFFNV